jgi:hypothetical protein
MLLWLIRPVCWWCLLSFVEWELYLCSVIPAAGALERLAGAPAAGTTWCGYCRCNRLLVHELVAGSVSAVVLRPWRCVANTLQATGCAMLHKKAMAHTLCVAVVRI